jgi:phage terminase large subunit-like protein
MDKTKLSKLTDPQILDLYTKLSQLDNHKKNNMLQYMDWDSYAKQNAVRVKILDRLLYKKGDKKIFVVFGGNRSGKTELGAGIVAEYLEKKSNIQVMCATVDYKLSVAVQQTKVSKLMTKSLIEYGVFNPVRGYTNDIILMKNGSKSIFRSYQQGREAVQGMDLDLIWWDEEGPWDYFQECLARLTDRDGIFLLTFTSLSGFTRLVNFLWESDNPLIESVVLSILDNPFIPESSKQNYLKTVDPDEVESRVHGRPHLKEGLIYKEFKPIHIIEPFDHVKLAKTNPRRYELHEGIDPHERTPHHWIRFLYDRKENKIYVCDELKAPVQSMVISDYARMIKNIRGSNKKGPILPLYCQIDTSSQKPDVINKHPDEDQENAHTIRQEFYRNGIETILCTKDNSIGLGEVKKRLKVVKTVDGTIKRMPLLYVFNTCKGTLWEFGRYSWDSYQSSKIEEKNEMLNRPKKKNDHFMDIIKYECIKMRNDVGSVDEYEEYEDQYEGMGY